MNIRLLTAHLSLLCCCLVGNIAAEAVVPICYDPKLENCEYWGTSLGKDVIVCSSTGRAEAQASRLVGEVNENGFLPGEPCGHTVVDPNTMALRMTAWLRKAGWTEKAIKELLKKAAKNPFAPVPCGEMLLSDTQCGVQD